MKHTKKLRVETIDCRKGLPSLGDNTIDLVITDPPYFIDGMGDNWNDKELTAKKERAGVIGGLPVGMKFAAKQSKELLAFLEPIAVELFRVTKPGGFVLCFMQPRLSHAAAFAMENAGIEIRDMLLWQHGGQAKAFSQNHFVRKRKDLNNAQKEEIIASLGGRKTPQLRPMGETIILGQVPREGTFVKNWLKWGVGLIDVSNPLIEPDKFPATIIPASKPTERYGHLTAKPVDLLRHLIRIFGGESPLVLDPFAGCGSTGEAAAEERCSFIGFEIERTYAARANKRIKTTLTTLG